MRKLTCAAMTSLLLAASGIGASAAGGIPGKGETLPSFQLSAPENEAQRTYLGLSKAGGFTISDIRADVVIIEIFSMYCPYCQREAPSVNELYRKIEANPGIKGKVKVIGIGAGNSRFEVDIFRKKYEVPFPLFPDNEFAVHKCLGEVRTPYFFAVKFNADRSHVILYSELGGLKNVDDFLAAIVKLAKLSPEG